MSNLKAALWLSGFALALQISFVLVVSIPGIFNPEDAPSDSWHHLVLWSMLCTLWVWIVLQRERRQRHNHSLENQ